MVHSSPNSHRAWCAKLEKRTLWLTDPPPLCIQMCSSSLNPIQIPRMLRHGGNLKLWRDIGRIFLTWGYIEISPNNRSIGIAKKRRQPWTSPQLRWIHPFFISRTHVNNLIFVAQHPNIRRTRHGDKHSSHCRVFKENRRHRNYFDSSDSGGTAACRPPFLPLIMHLPHKRAPKATRTCRGKMVLKHGKHM